MSFSTSVSTGSPAMPAEAMDSILTLQRRVGRRWTVQSAQSIPYRVSQYVYEACFS